ncbi:MAG TPA: hypothetical protein VHO06_28700, partial [Polyangia bacterium]|nr:hypothetical protein [Polyangia bacterium]
MKDQSWREALPELALGAVGDDERRRLEAAVAGDPAATREIAEAQAALASWAQAAAGAAAPPPALRRRLLESLGGVGRFQPFLELLARTFDLGRAAVDDLLRRVEGTAGWIDAAMPAGVRYFHFTPGPAAGAV